MATANHVLLRRITLSASASSVTFDNIPQTGYTDLKIVTSTRGTSTDTPIAVQFNSVTTGYSWRRIYGSGSAASSQSGSDNYFMYHATSSQTANTFGSGELYIPNYTGSQAKSCSFDSLNENNGAAADMFMLAGLNTMTAAITSITFTPYSGSFAAGSSFSLYGIADVNTTPKSSPKADGGDIIKTDGTYWYHAFSSAGVFKPQLNLTADVLLVAGGGGGGSDRGAGGGAGGVLYLASQALTTQSYVALVGAGGAGGVGGGSNNGTQGVNTTLGSLTAAVGGGYGTAGSGGNGGNGGSGGGAGGTQGGNRTGGSGTSGQGYAGGDGYLNAANDNVGSGGGGGAGGAGVTATGGNSGAGGTGINTYSSWLTAVGAFGTSGYIAAGGGGGSNNKGGAAASGGTGGGGSGGTGAAGSDATIWTGSGGGGGSNTGGQKAGGSGASGFIIIRYPV